MADDRRVVTAYLNVETSRNVSSTNTASRDIMCLFYGSQSLIRAYLRLADGITYMKPPTNSEWFFVIHDKFASEETMLVTSLNDQFNIAGDWSELDVANGLICFRVDTDVAALRTALAGEASKDMWGELWNFVGSEPKMLVSQWPITIRNIVLDTSL